ncbi:NAD(P)-dependent oxidoreductase [Aerococcus urinae]|uniref:NAD(P)-dependent oxidoreductase n=1 Tax=Aerococcus urinae TaxID=1376 RepID=A0A0X8FEN1_9LACT|nr:NAD(P)-dependent oxidoreductase [Aerococcus urinae]AMB95924.1 oxidoreductase [Aerococcus urinae]MCY3032512.1 NAD(P)-dependent oxidoreductase [Aerococcus urinae]MCY3038470.1 NAD(P)-dependent oxidoreductase [Aerococcus urinae]MCY3044558.1 NAD(P)-dependent oxidoreductase [Aerococcus urinae]MCY3046973.1 NAD(P)-dependent oxidoreductase [Aerococcus urinae]
MKIGFIGLGVMGKSMASHLIQAGYDLNVYNRTKKKAQPLIDLGAQWLDSPSQIADQSDLVFTILGYPHDVEEVYLGKTGLFSACQSGQIFVEMTTSSPSLAKKLYQEGQKRQVSVLDAPVTGGDIGAREGRLTTLVGGDKGVLDQLQPVLATFCQRIEYFGSAGKGQDAKMANQIMIAGTMTGMCEALAYAKNNDLNLDQVIETLNSGAAANFSLAQYGPRILKDDYSPGFFVKHFIKDLRIALEVAEKEDLKLPGTQLAYDLYQKLAHEFSGDDGIQALMKLWWGEK